MSNDADLEYGPTPPGSKYEHTDIDPSIGYKFGVWLAVSMAIGAAIVYGTYSLFERFKAERDAAPAYPMAIGQSQEPPLPRLQTQPFKDVYQLKAGERAVLHSYGWVDKANGVAHIPIDRAMELVLQRGLPARQGGRGENAIVQDASSGRTALPR